MPIVGTPYLSDDLINRLMPSWLAKPPRTHLYFIWQNNLAWMRQVHRFFPGAIALSTYVFSTFTTRVSYKVFLVVLLVAVLTAFAGWVGRAAGPTAALMAAAALVACWELRYTVTYDGLTGFSGLVPWTMLLIAAVMALFVRRPARPRWSAVVLIVGAALWLLAVCTYEYAVILAPSVIASCWLQSNDRRWRTFTSAIVGVMALAALAVAGLLHLHARGPVPPEWALSLRPGAWTLTTAKQLVSALPLSEYWIRAGGSPHVHLSVIVAVAAGVLAVVVAWSLVHQWRSWDVGATQSFRRLGLIGAWFWIAPALLTGATLRWQLVETWGQSYIPVLFETFGVSLVVVSLLGGARCRVRGAEHWPGYVATALLVVVGIAIALTAALNFSMVEPS